MPSPVLKLKGVSKEYHDISVLKNINLQLTAGRVCALVGSNGAGKSTLTKILTGETKLSAGRYFLMANR
jgi:ABC-type sugar transport system ATPase subunit